MGVMDRYNEKKKKQEEESQNNNTAPIGVQERYELNKSLGVTNHEVNEDFINTFISDANNFLSSAEKEYGSIGWSSASSIYDSRLNSWNDLYSRSTSIRRWLDNNKGNIDVDTYNGLMSNLDDIIKSSSSVLDGFKGAKDYYGQWDTEDAYNTWYEGYKAQQEILNAEDFEHYSQIGANIENPTYSEATGWLSVGSWRPFGDDIGNIVTFSRDNIDSITKEIGLSNSNADISNVLGDYRYQFMTDEEVAVYNYYLGKGDTEKAAEYLNSLNDTLNQRHAGQIVDRVDGNAFLELVFSAGAGIDQFASGIGNIDNLIKGIESDPTTVTQYAQSQMQANNEGVFKVANDFFYTTGNMLPSILVGSITGGLGGALTLGTSAVGNGYAEMRNLGYNEWQSRGYGLLVGASEAVLQYALGGISKLGGKVSGNAVSNLVAKVDNAIARTAIQLGGNMASEGLEEAIQTVLEPAFKALMTGEDFESPKWDEVLYSALLGALSAGILEGVPTIANTTINSYQTNKVYGSAAQALVNESLDIDPENAHAQRMQERLDNGKNVSGYQLNRLVEANEQTLLSQDTAKMKSAVEARLTELGETGDISKLADVIVKAQSGEKLTRSERAILTESKYGRRVSTELNPKSIESGQYTSKWAEGIGTERINTDAYNKALYDLATEQVGVAVDEEKPSVTVNTTSEEIATESEFKASEDGKTKLGDTEVSIKEIASVKNGEITLRLEDGSTVKASEIEFSSNEEGLLYENVVHMGLNAATANAFINGYDGSMPVAEYAADFRRAYRYGELGIPTSEMSSGGYSSRLSESQKSLAYNLGKTDAKYKVEKKQSDKAKIASTSAIKVGKDSQKTTKKGKLHNTLKPTNETQRASLKALGVLAEALNIDIYTFESPTDAKGRRLGENGSYDPRTKTLRIDLYAGADGKGTMLFTASHELTHHIREKLPAKFKAFADFLFEQYGEKGISVSELIAKKKAFLEERGRITPDMTEAQAYDLAYEEVVADACESFLADGDAVAKIAELKAKDKTLWQTIKDFITKLVARIKAAYEGLSPDSVEGRLVAEMLDSAEKLKAMWTEMLVEASEVTDIVEVDMDTESVAPMFSERTWTESEYVIHRDQMAEKIAKALGVSVKKAKSYIDDINSIAKMIAEDRVRLDYEASSFGSAFVSNVEYGGSFDYTTLCKKRRIYTGTFTEIQKRLKDVALTPNDILAIRNLMIEEGIEATCGLCYVEGSRANMGKFAKEFIRLYKRDNPNAWIPNMADVNTPDGVEQMRISHPEAYEQYVYFWNHYGKLKDSDKALFASQQKPKLYEARKEYKGEILEHFKGDTAVEKKNRNGGIRMQSFSDFEIVHLIDTMQVIMDMSTVGLAGQAYTKVPEFAKAFGNTGLKINLSLIAKGVDANGKLIFDDREGMPHKTAFELRDRYSKNVGTIIVTFTDEQLLAAMADPRIDFIIPFHRSQWKKGQYGAMGLPKGTKDYTYMQNEKLIKQTYHEYRGRMVKDKASNYMPNEYWDFSKSGKENAEAYLKMCAENNKRPKFYKLLDYDGKGTYSLKKDGSTDGYWKLLIDFKMYDNDGVGSPQMAVTPTFNMDEAKTMLDEYQGGHSKYPVASSVVDKFVENYNKDHSTKYSDRDTAYMDAVNRGDTATAQRMVDEVAKEAGYTVKGNHGTLSYFTIFDRSFGNAEGDWGKGFYFTNNEEDSETNYASADGADLQVKIEKYAQQLGWTEEYGDLDYDELIEVARKELTKGEPRVIKAYLKMDNPVIVGGKNETYFDFTEEYNEETEEYGEPSGKLVEFVEALASILEDYASNGAIDADNINVYELFQDGDGYTASQLEKAASNLLENVMDENGDYASKEIIRAAFEEIGFDGIVDNTVAGKFGDRSGRRNGGMVGVTLDTTHYVAFKSSQIKQSDPVTYDDNGNVIPLSKRFNPKNNDIRYSDRVLMGSLFSGGGTLEAGLVYQMLDKEFAVEYNEKIASAYTDNHGKEHMFVGDVRDFNSKEKQNVFYLHASPVCKNFSPASHSGGETTLDITTAQATARVLEEQMPQVFTVENVKRYIGSEAYNIIADKLNELGYTWDVDVYKASDYGNATKRERMIIRAVRDGQLPSKPQKASNITSWGEATKDLWKTELIPSYLVKSKIEAIKNTPGLKGVKLTKLDKPLLIYDTTKSKTVTYAWADELAPTLTTKCGDARIIMPDGRVYAPTPKFMGRIQGLPDDYKYPKATTNAFKIIGNGIPTQLTKTVMGGVLDSAYEQTHNGKVLYSDRQSSAPTFYSYMGKVIDGIKHDKMGAGDVVSYLKGKGVKNEEIKWSGIETWLEGKKSVTKAELQEFVAGSQLTIEEESSVGGNKITLEPSMYGGDTFDIMSGGQILDTVTWNKIDELYESDSTGLVFLTKEKALRYYQDKYERGGTRWSEYKLEGGENYRELVFKIPNSSYSNQMMRTHWGQDAEGVLAHARIQDFIVNGKKMLFIEEIQSDWHNEGHQKGYLSEEYEDALATYDKLAEDYANKRRAFNQYVRSNEFRTDADEVSKKKFNWLRSKMETAEKRMRDAERDIETLKEKGMGDVPDAPFRDTYHEYVLKRLLRMAAEEGYDSIGWTPADIQSKRWSEDYAEAYRIEYDQDIPKFLRKYGKKWGATVSTSTLNNKSYDVTYLDTNGKQYKSVREWYEAVMDSYAEKNHSVWNDYIMGQVKVIQDGDTMRIKLKRTGEILDESLNVNYAPNTVWSMSIPDSMKDSVLNEGQVLYSDRKIQPITESETTDLEKHFGTTGNFRVAGYLLTDGKLLDFSGKHWGDTTSRSRQVDHRDVSEVLNRGNNGFDDMVDMIGSGNIRLMPEIGGINLAVYPNEKQRKVLSVYINYMLNTEGQIIIDYDSVGGDTVYSKEYGKTATSRQILADIRNYFNGARQSELMQFHTMYSDRNPDSVSNRSLLANALESAVKDGDERNKLRNYKSNLRLLEAEQAKLAEVRKEANEIRFTKGRTAEETMRMKDLDFEAKQIASRINSYDRELLKLEAMQPIKDVLNREKQMAYKRAEQKGRDALKAQREKDAKTQRELLTRYQESRKKGIESRKKTEMRHKIKDVVNDLNQYLLNGTKDKHVPIELQKAVAEALDAVNMDTVGAEERIAKKREEMRIAASKGQMEKVERLAKEIEHIQEIGGNMAQKISRLKTSYDSIINSDDPLIANSHDEVISNSIDKVLEVVGETPLRDMSLYQLEAVYDMYRMILRSIQTANKAFKAEKGLEISVLANTVIADLEDTKRSRLNVANTTFAWNNLKPVYAFERIGSNTLTKLFNAVRAGEDVWARDMSEAQAFREEQSKKFKFDSWDFEKKYTFYTESGKSFELDLGEMMSIYAFAKDAHSKGHLIGEGFVFDPKKEVVESIKGKIKVKVNLEDATAYNLSEEIVEDIKKTLFSIPGVKDFVDAMQDYLSTTMGEKGNEVSLELYEIKLFKNKNYFPLKVAPQYMAVAKEKTQGDVKIKNKGFTKDRKDGAKNPIVLSSFMDVWANHVNEMSMYHAFTLPLEDFYRVFNYKTPRMEGYAPMSVNASLENAFGKAATAYIDQLLKDLNGGARVDPTVGIINKLTGLFKKSAVFASASVVVQQPSAIARATALVDTKYFVGKPSGKHKETWAEVKKYAPVAVIKEMGYFDTGMGKSSVEWLKGEKTLKDKIDDVASKAPALADELAWCAIWKAVKRETLHTHKNLTPNSEEFLNAVGERFTEVITKTQVYDSVLSRSANMRSKDTGMKMATAFMAEPTTSINMIQDALTQGKRGNKRYARKAIGSVVASMILNSILVSFVYAGRDDDEDKTYTEKYVGTLTEELIDSINPLTLIPFVKDIVSIVQGYDVERSDMAVITDIIKAWNNLDSDNRSVYRKVEDFVGAIASVFGLPVKNIMRDARAMYNTVNSFIKGQQTTGAGIKDALTEAVTGNTKSNGQQLYEAILSGDTAQIERVKGRFKDQDAINSAIRKALRDNDPRIKQAAEARYNGNIAEYMRIAKEIIAEGYFKQDDIVSAINSEITAMKKGEGTTESSSSNKVTSIYKMDDYYAALVGRDQATAYAVKEDLIKTDVANGKDRDEAEADFNSRFASYLREEYEKGNLSDYEARNMLVNYADKSEEDAYSKVQYWDFKIMYPDYDLSEEAVKKYYNEVEPSGIGVDVYYDYSKQRAKCKGVDANGDGKTDSGSVKREVMQVINSLPITNAQKDALYYLNGWSASTIWEAPWH